MKHKKEYSKRVICNIPYGGVYYIIYFMDKNGKPTDESKAEKMEIHEFDKNGNVIYRTYSAIKK